MYLLRHNELVAHLAKLSCVAGGLKCERQNKEKGGEICILIEDLPPGFFYPFDTSFYYTNVYVLRNAS